MKEYNQEQICNIIGASSRTRFAMVKKFKNALKTTDQWIEDLKAFSPVDSEKLKSFLENS